MVRFGAAPLLAMLVIAGLAGCVSDEVAPEVEESSIVETEIVDSSDPAEVAAETGTVEGEVLTESGFAVQDALVLLITEEGSVKTGADGKFQFKDVRPGQSQLRVEKENYKTLLQPIEVVAGKITQVQVILVPSNNLNAGFREHVHDFWGGQDRITLIDETHEWPSLRPTTAISYVNYCYDCSAVHFVLPEGTLVPPGTASIEVSIDYEEEVEQDWQRFTMRANPEPCGENYCPVPYFYEDATPGGYETTWDSFHPGSVDHGHATQTGWTFSLYWYEASAYARGDLYNELSKKPITIKVEAIKGEVTADPPHKRFWKDTDEIILTPAYKYPCILTCATIARTPEVPSTYCSYHCIILNKHNTIPPGTTRLEVNFTWELYSPGAAPAAYDALFPHEYGIGYLPADVDRKTATWDDYTWPTYHTKKMHDDDMSYTLYYTIDVESGQQDAFYESFSKWVFSIYQDGETHADEMENECGQSYLLFASLCGYPRMILEVAAYNDLREEQIASGDA